MTIDDKEYHTIIGKVWRIDSMLKMLKHYASPEFRPSTDSEQVAHDIRNQVDAIRGVLLSLEQHLDSGAELVEDEDDDEAARVEEAVTPSRVVVTLPGVDRPGGGPLGEPGRE